MFIMKNDYHINTMYFFNSFRVKLNDSKRKQGKITNDTFMDIVISVPLISTSSASWSTLNTIPFSLLLLVNHTTILDDLSNWSYKWLSKTMRSIMNNSILRTNIIYTIYILKFLRTFFWWWWTSERSRINFERSSMSENLAWRWFEDNVFENLVCWSYIFAKYI